MRMLLDIRAVYLSFPILLSKMITLAGDASVDGSVGLIESLSSFS